jgi:UDP-N-acetylmuramate--alanine ligase
MRTVAVAGTHGKTTTTGMLARILSDARVSPTAIIGSLVRDFGSNYLPGTSEWFVVEACEYKRDFLSLSPEVLAITNIELDHTDYYRDLADIQSAFRALALKVPASGFIVANPSDPNVAPVLENLPCRVIDYTREAGYPVRFPGAFNVANARTATATARLIVPGLTEDTIRDSLAAFEGTWRRFEYRGKTARGADVYDDYAHHPTAVRGTIGAVRGKMETEGKKGKLYLAFHPHLFSRTKDLLPEFATAFGGVDHLLVAPIYPAREVDDGTMSSAILADTIKQNGVDATPATHEEIEALLRREPGEGDVVMTMGAGDIFRIADAIAGA